MGSHPSWAGPARPSQTSWDTEGNPLWLEIWAAHCGPWGVLNRRGGDPCGQHLSVFPVAAIKPSVWQILPECWEELPRPTASRQQPWLPAGPLQHPRLAKPCLCQTWVLWVVLVLVLPLPQHGTTLFTPESSSAQRGRPSLGSAELRGSRRGVG